MQFALLIYHSPEEFAMRENDYNHPHLGAWRSYYKALVEAGAYVAAALLKCRRRRRLSGFERVSAGYKTGPTRRQRSNLEDSSF